MEGLAQGRVRYLGWQAGELPEPFPQTLRFWFLEAKTGSDDLKEAGWTRALVPGGGLEGFLFC